jgi:hypothetical protein
MDEETFISLDLKAEGWFSEATTIVSRGSWDVARTYLLTAIVAVARCDLCNTI